MLPRRRHSDHGFALFEAVIAAALAAVAVAGIASMMAATSKANQTSRATTGAVALAREMLESARATGYDNLAHSAGVHVGDSKVSAGKFDPDGAGPLPSENVLYKPSGQAGFTKGITRDGLEFDARTYVTETATAAKRVTVLVEWRQQGQSRSTSLTSLVAPPASPLSAAADAFGGQTGSGAVTPVVSSRSRRGGGYDSDSAASATVLAGWSVTGAATSTEVVPATRHTADVAMSSASIVHNIAPDVNIIVLVSGMKIHLEALPNGATSTTSSGSVTVNGVNYTDPPPGTQIAISGWIVALNSRTTTADGSTSVSFVRLLGPNGEDLRLGWAWVSPVTSW